MAQAYTFPQISLGLGGRTWSLKALYLYLEGKTKLKPTTCSLVIHISCPLGALPSHN